MIIDLKELYSLQAELDLEIAKNHHVSYESTFSKRLLALLVELGELANETRSFKYWSTKEPSSKEIVIDEYADALHFALSLGIKLNPDKYVYEVEISNKDINEQLIHLYDLTVTLHKEYNLGNYYTLMKKFLSLGVALGFSDLDIIQAYKNKLKINHQRQENNY